MGLYTDQKCQCGKTFQHDASRRGCFCPSHPNHRATRYIVKVGKNKKRFTSYSGAESMLKLWERGNIGPSPLGLVALSLQYLHRKKVRVSTKHHRNVSNDMGKLVAHFGDIPIHKLTYAELDDFFFPVHDDHVLTGLASKTIYNIRSTVNDFFTWLIDREIIGSKPRIPQVKYELGWRKLIDRDTQIRIINRIALDCKNPRVAIAIRWLATYINIRPGELVQIRWGDVDLKLGTVTVPARVTKERRNKIIHLCRGDIKDLEGLGLNFPSSFLFCHAHGGKFGHNYLYEWWKRACKKLKVVGVDLYGGTRHSTVTYLRGEGFSPEEIRRASMHSTNKAFERYLQKSADEVTPIYDAARIELGNV